MSKLQAQFPLICLVCTNPLIFRIDHMDMDATTTVQLYMCSKSIPP